MRISAGILEKDDKELVIKDIIILRFFIFYKKY